MKFKEFDKAAQQQLAEKRSNADAKLDEILPAIAAVAGGIARAGVGLAARGAAAAGRAATGAIARGAAGAAKGIGRAATRAIPKSIGGRNDDEPETNNPNDKIGTQTNAPTQSMGTTGTQGTAGTQGGTSSPVDNLIKQGKTLKLPSKTAAGTAGPAKAFKVTRVQGDDVEIENPMPKPGEPQKFVFKKDDLKGALGNEAK